MSWGNCAHKLALVLLLQHLDEHKDRWYATDAVAARLYDWCPKAVGKLACISQLSSLHSGNSRLASAPCASRARAVCALPLSIALCNDVQPCSSIVPIVSNVCHPLPSTIFWCIYWCTDKLHRKPIIACIRSLLTGWTCLSNLLLLTHAEHGLTCSDVTLPFLSCAATSAPWSNNQLAATTLSHDAAAWRQVSPCITSQKVRDTDMKPDCHTVWRKLSDTTLLDIYLLLLDSVQTSWYKINARECQALKYILHAAVHNSEILHLTFDDIPLMHAPAASSSSRMSLHSCGSSTRQAKQLTHGWPCMHATLNQQLTASIFVPQAMFTRLVQATSTYQGIIVVSDMGCNCPSCQQSHCLKVKYHVYVIIFGTTWANVSRVSICNFSRNNTSQ